MTSPPDSQEQTDYARRAWWVPLALSLLLLLVNHYDHLLFRTLAELFAVAVAVMASVVGWHTYPFTRNNFIMCLAAGYLWIGALDLLHTLTYPGMSLFRGVGPGVSIQFWIATRYLEALLLLTAPLFLERRCRRRRTFVLFGAIAVTVTVLIASGHFPETFISGSGLTPFKIVSEYVIVLLLLGAVVHLWRRRTMLDPEIYRLIAFAILFTIGAEVAFTLHRYLGDTHAVVGHLAKFISYWLIYVAIIRTTLTEPFRAMARTAGTYDAFPDIAFVVDRSGRVRQANRAARAWVGGDEAQWIGHHCHELFHPSQLSPADCPVCRNIAAGIPLGAVELAFPGRRVWHEVSLSAIDSAAAISGMVHVSRDVTQSKLAEEALQQSHEQLSSLLQSVGDGVYGIDVEGRATFVNAAFERLTGWPVEQVIGERIHDLIHHTRGDGEHYHFSECPAYRTVRYGLPQLASEETFWRRDGSSFVAEYTSAAVHDPEGELTGAVVVFRDISERKQAEEALRRSEAGLAEAQRIAHLGSWEWALAEDELHWSEELYRIFGLEPGRFSASYEGFLERVHPEDRPRVEAAVEATLLRDAPYTLEIRILLPDGTVRTLDVVGRLERDDAGAPRRLIGTGEDVTERKEAERRLRESEARFRSLIETSRDFVWELDAAGRYTFVSPKVEAILGFTPEEVVGHTPFELMPADEAARLRTVFTALADARVPIISLENTNIHKDGSLVVLETDGVPWFDDEGRFRGYRGVDKDVTERKQSEQALRESERKYRTLTENLPQSVFLKGLDSLYLSCNRNFAVVLGIDPADIVGKSDDDFFPADIAARYQEGDREVIERGETVELEQPMVVGGEEVVINTIKTPVFDDDGNVIGVLGIFWDVTERRRMEDALRESKEQLEGIFANIHVLVAYLDASFNFIRVNRTYAAAAGHPAEFFAGRNHFELYPDEATEAIFRRVVESGIPYSAHAKPFLLPDEPEGQLRYWDWTLYPVRDVQGRVSAVLLSLLEVTERVQAEQALRDSERRYRALLENASDAIVVTDIDGRLVDVNRQAEELFGYTHDELLRMRSRELCPPEEREHLKAVLRELNASGVSLDERLVLCKDGARRQVEVAGARIDIAGNTLYQGTFRDITERRAAEEALRESESRYRALMESASDAILVATPEERIIDANRRAESLFGYSKEELLHLTPQRLHPKADLGRIAAVFDALRRGETGIVAEYAILRKDGAQIPIELAADAITYGGQTVFLGAFRDISERKRTERELHQYRTNLEQRVAERTAKLTAVVRELESFSYSVSHDLHAPLRAINGFSQALQEDYDALLDAAGRSYLERIRTNTTRMGQLIDGLLMLSRVSRREPELQDNDLSAMAREVAAELVASEPERVVQFDIADGLHASCDRALCRLLLENLLGNAWKFTRNQSDARIEVGSALINGRQTFYIRDNGEGFDMLYSDKLFKPFHRLHAQEEYPGTGIGLATVQRIIQQHGGFIMAEGEVGVGATIYFSFAPVEAQVTAADGDRSLTGEYINE